MVSARRSEPWRRRLFLPNYQVGEAARYADISPKTVADWHRIGSRRTLSPRENRAALSYLQLIEVAVVASLRKEGVKLSEIRNNREYVSKQLQSEFPYAEYKFKTDGKDLFMDYEQFVGEQGQAKLIRPSMGGQLAWAAVIGRLKEFEYEDHGVAISWRVAGLQSDIIIDPRVAFGAPTVMGIPTWTIKGRWEAGESLSDIAEDFDVDDRKIKQALKFEGVTPIDPKWTN